MKMEIEFRTVGWIEYASSLPELYNEIKRKRELLKKIEQDIEFMVEIHEQRALTVYNLSVKEND